MYCLLLNNVDYIPFFFFSLSFLIKIYIYILYKKIFINGLLVNEMIKLLLYTRSYIIYDEKFIIYKNISIGKKRNLLCYPFHKI